MILPAITNWDDAYANRAHIPNANDFVQQWDVLAAQFRTRGTNAALDVAYSDNDHPHADRCRYDLFPPESGPSKGMFVFIHGGYWLAFDKNTWSHFAGGAQAAGFTVMMPSYPLCPDARIDEIVACTAAAVEHAAMNTTGPIILCGHSAGGHLATSLVSSVHPLSESVRARIAHVVSISGVHDLRPLLNTTMNEQLNLTPGSAQQLSPALAVPMINAPITAWVGGTEREEFLRHSALLANVWRGFGVATCAVREPDRHHFNVIDGLSTPGSSLLAHAFSVL